MEEFSYYSWDFVGYFFGSDSHLVSEKPVICDSIFALGDDAADTSNQVEAPMTLIVTCFQGVH